jgi:hypothetical protein
MATELRRTSARPNQLLGSISVPPFTGDRCIVAGLTTSGRGELGSFHADVVRLRDQGPVPNRGIAATFEQHVFTLAEGTLVGSGTSDDGGDGTFAVVGGTGAYATMRGSYTAEQQRSDMGGDGQARFVFCLSK